MSDTTADLAAMTAAEKRDLLAQLLHRGSGPAVSNLTLGQRRLWFLRKLDASVPWHVFVALRIQGAVNLAALQQAFTGILQRHEVLRSVFTEIGGQPLRTVQPSVSLAIPLLELGNGTGNGSMRTDLDAIAVREFGTPFDVGTGPVVRMCLVRCSADEHALLVTAHQLVADRASLDVIINELVHAYTVLVTGGIQSADAALADPASTGVAEFAHLVRAQREWLATEEAAAQSDRLRDALVGTPTLDMPSDRPRPVGKTFPGVAVTLDADEPFAASVLAFAARVGIPASRVLLVGMAALLGRFCERDFAIGVATSAWRESTARVGGPLAAQVVGPLSDVTPVRFKWSSDPSFAEWTRAAVRLIGNAVACARVPFERAVEAVAPRRDLSHSPIYQVSFAEEPSYEDMAVPGATVARLDLPTGFAAVDLELTVRCTQNGLALRLTGNSDLFDAATLRQLLHRLVRLLSAGIADADAPISRLPIMDDAERERVVVTWNRNAVEFPAHLCLHELVERQAAVTPHVVALRCGDQELTYTQLDARADALAARLGALGVGPESRVGVLADRSVGAVVALLGVLKAGGAYVPVDPTYPVARLRSVLADAAVAAVVGTPELSAVASQVEPVFVEVPQADEDAASPAGDAVRARPDNEAYVIYTSGSTGRPKGVAVSHRHIVASTAARWQYEDLRDPERYLVMAPLTFDASGGGLYLTLTKGGTVIIPTDIEVHDPRALGKLIRSARVTHFDGVPSQYSVLLETDMAAMESVRCCVLAGESLPPALVARHFDRNPHTALLNEYGPTESTVWATVFECRPAHGLSSSVPIGRPVANARVYVLDEFGEPVAVGVPGELFIGGEGVARGYVNQPGLTAARFVPDPFGGGARLYRTGDRARLLPDGNIDFLGRMDSQVKVRGFRVELGEIEAVIGRHPLVAEAVVTVREDSPGVQRLVAHVVPAAGRVVTQEDLSRHILAGLPDYMVPSAFVLLERMPLTPHGKIDRAALPAPTVDFGPNGYREPRTPLEIDVAECFAEIFGLPKVSADADFFELGGNSLLVARMIARLARSYDVAPPVDEIFRVPTVAGIAATIETHQRLKAGTLDEDMLYAVGVAELRAEVKLDPAIRVDDRLPVADYLRPAHVLLTGSTGYIGAFILDELVKKTTATIHCLVRADGEDAAWSKLEAVLSGFGVWNETLRQRVQVLVGDLGKPALGLSVPAFDDLAQEIDAIYHSGAIVNFTFPYDALQAVNVAGTQELLKLACYRKTKAFHHVSTMDVFVGTRADRPWREVDPNDTPSLLPTGYPRSKWVAEKLVAIARDRGLPVCVYRPWVVVGHRSTGAAHKTDYIFVALKGYLELGFLPSYTEILNAVPVDYFAEAMVHLSLREQSFGKYFNVGNLWPVDFPKIYEWLASFGYRPQVIDRATARQRVLDVDERSTLYAITPLIRSGRPDHPWLQPERQRSIDPTTECRNVLDGLRDSGIECPPMSEQLAHTCLRYMVDIGYLPDPAALTNATT